MMWQWLQLSLSCSCNLTVNLHRHMTKICKMACFKVLLGYLWILGSNGVGIWVNPSFSLILVISDPSSIRLLSSYVQANDYIELVSTLCPILPYVQLLPIPTHLLIWIYITNKITWWWNCIVWVLIVKTPFACIDHGVFHSIYHFLK